jgi:Ribonuclease G/E
VSRDLVVAVSPGEIWAALVEDDALTALRLVRSFAPSLTGEVYLGRVVALRPDLPAALVDIGLARPGFLDAADIDKKRGLLGITEGQALIVEVIKEARADKATGLRLLRASPERRARIEDEAKTVPAPARLEKPPPAIVALLAEFMKPPPDRIVIDDRAALAEARLYLRREHPDLLPRLELHVEATPVFEHAGLAAEIDEVMAARVELPGGGTIFIEPTHAATMIDVDSGKAGPLAANLAAAAAAARQIRLRNLAGAIVIDFVGMKGRGDRDKVLAALKAALAADREKPEILGWTRLGHIELARRRRRPSIPEILFEPGPDGTPRKSAMTIAVEALRAVERAARTEPGRRVALALHPEIAAALDAGEGRAARAVLEARLGHPLAIEAQPERARDRFDLL